MVGKRSERAIARDQTHQGVRANKHASVRLIPVWRLAADRLTEGRAANAAAGAGFPNSPRLGDNLRFETNDEGIDLVALGFRNAEGVQRGIQTRHKRRVVSRCYAHPIVRHLHCWRRRESAHKRRRVRSGVGIVFA